VDSLKQEIAVFFSLIAVFYFFLDQDVSRKDVSRSDSNFRDYARKRAGNAPILAQEIGLKVIVPDNFNTDRFGTFTREY